MSEQLQFSGALGLINHFRPIIWAENNAYFDSGGKARAFGLSGKSSDPILGYGSKEVYGIP